MTIDRIPDQDKAKAHKLLDRGDVVEQMSEPPEAVKMRDLQQQVGNRALQRLLNKPCEGCPDEPSANLQTRLNRTESLFVQRAGDGGPFDLDDDTAGRIKRERSGGQPLDGGVQAQIGEAVGADFGGVRVHTSAESDALNRDLGAKAFTTGQDIFFREGAYQPHSSGGQELLAHELTHVVQQGSGAVGGSGGHMRVNAPGDAFEQQADAVAHAITAPSGIAPSVQRQAAQDEEEVQMQAAPEEEEDVQMQAAPEEEEDVQMQEDEDDMLQKQEFDEEEEKP